MYRYKGVDLGLTLGIFFVLKLFLFIFSRWFVVLINAEQHVQKQEEKKPKRQKPKRQQQLVVAVGLLRPDSDEGDDAADSDAETELVEPTFAFSTDLRLLFL